MELCSFELFFWFSKRVFWTCDWSIISCPERGYFKRGMVWTMPGDVEKQIKQVEANMESMQLLGLNFLPLESTWHHWWSIHHKMANSAAVGHQSVAACCPWGSGSRSKWSSFRATWAESWMRCKSKAASRWRSREAASGGAEDLCGSSYWRLLNVAYGFSYFLEVHKFPKFHKVLERVHHLDCSTGHKLEHLSS